MRTRLRLGAAAAVGLGALLLATVLASPALAWHSNVDVKAECLDDGQIGVSYTVTAWEEGHDALVKVFYELNGEKTDRPSGEFNDKQSSFSDDFVLPAGTHGSVTVTAVAYWKGAPKSSNSSEPTKLPYKCKPTETTAPPTTAPPTTAPPTTAPPTTAPPTTTPPSSSVAPTTSLEQTTTSAAVGAVTSTTPGGGQLPFTGASSGPMLLAGIVLVGGGSLFLLISRARDGHATK
jgi:endoglucanase